MTMKKGEVLSVGVVDQTTGGEYGDGSLLDDERIINELFGKKAHSDLNILVYAKDGEYEDNLNEDTLNYVREHRPELISGDKWADDTLIISLNVESEPDDIQGSGQVGTYFGENVKIESQEQQQTLQAHGYSDFQAKSWDTGVIAVADATIDSINSPVVLRILGIVISCLFFITGTLLLIIGVASLLAIRAAEEELDATTANVDLYVRNADNVLLGQYASTIKENSHDILRGYTDLLEKRDGYSKTLFSMMALLFSFRAFFFHKKVKDLSHEVSLVSDTMLIYERDKGWQEAWKRQTADVRQAINDMRKSTTADGMSVKTWTEQFNDIEKELYEGNTDVDYLFSRVDSILQDISSAVQAESDMETQLVSNANKRSYIEKEIQRELRRNHRRRGNTLFFYYSPTPYYTYSTYHTGYNQGIDRYTSSQSSSSGSSSSSYGGSGGGFSGSGSSSRF